MEVLILAAGYGTRAKNFSENKPKQLLEIKENIPTIELILQNLLKEKSIKKINIITNNKFYNQFESWLNKSKLKNQVFLINNKTNSNEERLGSVGDILYASSIINIKNNLLVVQGDDLLHNLNLKKILKLNKKHNSSVIVTHRMEAEKIAKRFGVVTIDKNKLAIKLQEKPNLEEIETKNGTALANGGTYMLTKKEIENILKYQKETMGTKKSPLDKTGEWFSWIIKNGGKILTHEHPKEYWWDIGKEEELNQAREFYQKL